MGAVRRGNGGNGTKIPFPLKDLKLKVYTNPRATFPLSLVRSDTDLPTCGFTVLKGLEPKTKTLDKSNDLTFHQSGFIILP
jgi:hypothetical protein